MEGTFHAIIYFITFGYGWPLHYDEGGINHNKRGVKRGGDGNMGSWCLSLYLLDIYEKFVCQVL